MDLSTVKPSERIVEILSPANKQPIGIRVTLLHIDDPRLKKLKRSFQDEKSRLEQRGKYFKAEDIETNTYGYVFLLCPIWWTKLHLSYDVSRCFSRGSIFYCVYMSIIRYSTSVKRAMAMDKPKYILRSFGRT
jgi:hypothetical protein